VALSGTKTGTRWREMLSAINRTTVVVAFFEMKCFFSWRVLEEKIFHSRNPRLAKHTCVLPLYTFRVYR